MSEEPAEPRARRGDPLIQIGREDLELYGVDELVERVGALEAEIVRTRAQIEKKRFGRSAADALFGSKG